MGESIFWEVIGHYNQNTVCIQCAILVMLVLASVTAFMRKKIFILLAALGIVNLFIAVGFFAVYGTQPVQRFFALPLYLSCGALFIYEAFRSRGNSLIFPDRLQSGLLVLYLLYPAVSMLLGGRFPKMVTHIMPCPVVSLSIVLYSCCKRKNLALLILLTVWGLTGVKAVIFSAYEDIILLLCGIYGVYLIIREIRSRAS